MPRYMPRLLWDPELPPRAVSGFYIPGLLAARGSPPLPGPCVTYSYWAHEFWHQFFEIAPFRVEHEI